MKITMTEFVCGFITVFVLSAIPFFNSGNWQFLFIQLPILAIVIEAGIVVTDKFMEWHDKHGWTGLLNR